MVLDHGGPALGMILYGSAVKLFVFAALLARLAVPAVVAGPALAWALTLGGVLAVAVVIGVVESSMARLRLTHVPAFLVAALLLSAFGVVLLFR